MIETLISCDYPGYCSMKRKKVEDLAGWYAIDWTVSDDGFNLHIAPLSRTRGAQPHEKLACCEEHADSVAQIMISKWLRDREAMKVPEVPTERPSPPALNVQDDKSEDIPF